jgi:hypothetical protein
MHGIQQIKLKIGLLACRPGDLKRLQHLASCHDLRSHVSVPVEEVAMPCMHFETTNDAGRLTTCMCTYMHVDVVVGNGLARERARDRDAWSCGCIESIYVFLLMREDDGWVDPLRTSVASVRGCGGSPPGSGTVYMPRSTMHNVRTVELTSPHMHACKRTWACSMYDVVVHDPRMLQARTPSLSHWQIRHYGQL